MSVAFDSLSNELLFTAFQAALGLAVSLGGLTELLEGRLKWSAVGHVMAQSGQHGARERERVLEAVNRISIVGRLSLGLGLSVGVGGALLSWSVVFLLAVALRLRPKHNLLYIAACIVVISTAGPIEVFYPKSSTVPSWAPLTVAILLFGLYINGAWWKWKSPQFRSGAAVYVVLARHHLSYRPDAGRQWQASERLRSWCHRIALTVIAVEVALPVLLLLPRLAPIAFGVGAVFHTMLLAVQPSRLLPFQIATLASYACVEMLR